MKPLNQPIISENLDINRAILLLLCIMSGGLTQHSKRGVLLINNKCHINGGVACSCVLLPGELEFACFLVAGALYRNDPDLIAAFLSLWFYLIMPELNDSL